MNNPDAAGETIPDNKRRGNQADSRKKRPSPVGTNDSIYWRIRYSAKLLIPTQPRFEDHLLWFRCLTSLLFSQASHIHPEHPGRRPTWLGPARSWAVSSHKNKQENRFIEENRTRPTSSASFCSFLYIYVLSLRQLNKGPGGPEGLSFWGQGPFWPVLKLFSATFTADICCEL